MNFTSIVDIYFVSVGLLSYNILYSVLFDTGAIYLPFLMVLFSDMSEAFSTGRTTSLQRKIEVKFGVMFICIALTFVPVIDYKISGVNTYTRMCEIDGSKKYFNEEPEGYASAEVRNVLVNVSGYDLKIPLLLGMVYNFATGFTLEAVDRLPCSINLTAFNAEMMNTIIADPNLLVRTRAFMNTCYYPAKVLAIRNKDFSIPWINEPDGEVQPWPGSPAFFNKSYYQNVSAGFYSKSLLDGYRQSPNNQNISSWQDDDGVQTLGGFPTCQEWWNGVGDGFSGTFTGGSKGLRHELMMELIEAHNKDRVDKFFNIAKIYGGGNIRENEDLILQAAYFNQYNIDSIENAETVRDFSDRSEGFVSGATEIASRAAGTYGVVKSAFPSYAGASIIQLAAPIFKAGLLMIIFALAPIGSIASNFSFKYIVPLYFFTFSIITWSFFWELSMLVQQAFVDETLGEGVDLDIALNPNIALVGTSITDLLFVTFPTAVTGIITLAGVNLQSVAGFSDKPGASEGSAGKNGGKGAQGVVEDKVGSNSSGSEGAAKKAVKTKAKIKR